MANRLQGKKALITAAGQGMGRAAALAFAREGASVLATDVNPKLLEGFAGQKAIRGSRLDVTDERDVNGVREFVADDGILENNTPSIEMTCTSWRRRSDRICLIQRKLP